MFPHTVPLVEASHVNFPGANYIPGVSKGRAGKTRANSHDGKASKAPSHLSHRAQKPKQKCETALTLVYTVGPTLVAVAKATVHWMVVALVVYLIICHVILVAARVCCTLLQGLWHWFSYWGQRQRLLQATTTCPVCLDDFGSGSQGEGEVAPGNGVDVPLCSLVCGHVFHDGCVRPWVALHNTCPCCRLHVTR